ncbi:hypothetical protein VP01_2294g1 [Puccinia sorghi]|uniref:Retrovirus-related Pol polyprotein from transposon TNT 1-94-like beta-barrel domain-containing protein n=1 Tax=Puccinia sorghi TaxID=27349 RepID=A0A0L6V853_9BASI|nr:hypothetical protein VP01_2294g1 [Puccinia sorghi]
MSTLEIKGKGTIRVSFNDKSFIFHNVLLVPKITVNVLSLRHLLLDLCNVNFEINHFSISKDDAILFEGRYHNNLPILEFEPMKHQSHLSSAELLHKSLGHQLSLTDLHPPPSHLRNCIWISLAPSLLCHTNSINISSLLSTQTQDSWRPSQ